MNTLHAAFLKISEKAAIAQLQPANQELVVEHKNGNGNGNVIHHKKNGHQPVYDITGKEILLNANGEQLAAGNKSNN